MKTKQVINSMDRWLENNYDNVMAKKIDGDNLSTISDIEDGSYDEAAHLKWMIIEMRTIDDKEKLMRWIGFMQGALWSLGLVSIDDFREMNS